MKWRQEAARVIHAVITTHPDARGPELMALLRAAYPFGRKENHPYRAWRLEVRRQLGIDQRPKSPRRRDEIPPEQGTLW